MKRLTTVYTQWNVSCKHPILIDKYELADRLSKIEDILGDEYDLERLAELITADREGRVVIKPGIVYKIGETKGIFPVPYRPWMENYIGDKFYLSEEAAKAALKEKHHK